MKNYWFDLCYSAINGVCLMYLENFAAHEINFAYLTTITTGPGFLGKVKIL